MNKLALASFPLCLILVSACGSEAGTKGEEANTIASSEMDDIASPAPSPPDAPLPAQDGEPLPTSLPSAFQGRWGLTANDCAPDAPDNKGLIVVKPDSLEYYESMGKLNSVLESGPKRIRAKFDFDGEGMTWQREMVLETSDGANTLTTTQFGDDVLPGPLRYSKCS